MARNWTPDQTRAIETSGRDLLVSAAAGSGKTATLTERILRRLTAREHPGDISRMLIVTFTKAAAAELRERIAGALGEAIAADPTNRRLTSQLLKLEQADICTIDSFCYKLVREHFDALGLPAKIAIGDTAEIALLRRKVMDEVIDELYAVENDPAFLSLCELFSDLHEEDALAETLLTLEQKMDAYPESVELLLTYADDLDRSADGSFFHSAPGAALCESLLCGFAHFSALYGEACDYLKHDETHAQKYLPAFAADRDAVDAILEALRNNDHGAAHRRAMRFAETGFEKLSSLGKAATEEAAAYKEMRDEFKDFWKDTALPALRLPPEEAAEGARYTAEKCRVLHRVLTRFRRTLDAEKAKRALCDFSDLARYSLALLWKDGEPSEIARTVGARYDEICIDEYQDTSAVQDAIFRAVGSVSHRFMVGDIKQSIYKFRGAEPSIFAAYRRDLPPLGESSDAHGNTIFLSQNFRSHKTVTDFVNAVFTAVLPRYGGMLGYDREDALDPACGIVGSHAAEVVLVDQPPETEENAEAAYVARRIRHMLDEETLENGEPVRPRDIAILMRSAKSKAAIFEEALAAAGVTGYNNTKERFFEYPEVLLVLSLINAVDNPLRDIYLAGTMRSPVFGFTLDELIAIRRTRSGGALYHALEAAADPENDTVDGALREKCAAFLARLCAYREHARTLPTDKLLRYLYRETGILSLAPTSSAERYRANLMLLYDYARSFEAGTFRGLYNFILYINGILEDGGELEGAQTVDESDDVVRIMTIHQSKGLEFPICFVVGTEKKYNTLDAKSALLFDRKTGVAMHRPSEDAFFRVRTPQYAGVAESVKSLSAEEEMRILYVALTRAKERLIVTASGKVGKKESANDKQIARAKMRARQDSPFAVRSCASFLELILFSLFVGEGAPATFRHVRADTEEELVLSPHAQAEQQPERTDGGDAFYETLSRRFSFTYPHAHLAKIPAKLSVSKLYPEALDGAGEEVPLQITSDPDAFRLRPRFLSESEATATGAEIGTATHVFLQFCDFARLAEDGAKAELDRLVSEKFISPGTASLVRLADVEKFRESRLLADLLAARELYREQRFTLVLPADRFTADGDLAAKLCGEELLVQGVIDCLYRDKDGALTLLDYKTDALTAAEKADPALAAEKLVPRHARQLAYYREAVRRMMGEVPARVVIYSLPLGGEIALSEDDFGDLNLQF